MDVRLSLCMIVRNEAEELPRCLESVQGVVDELVVVDTGSQDGTVDVARRYGAVVREIPWQNDFAAARNASLSLASGEWILWLDADEELLPASRQLIPALLSAADTEGYFIQLHNLLGSRVDPETEVALLFRLWRNRPEYRFVGAIHEQIAPVIRSVNPQAKVAHSPLEAVHYGYLREHVAAKGKENRNLQLLEASLRAQPNDPFLQFNLGVEHFVRGRFQPAREALERSLERVQPDALWRPRLAKGYAATLCELARWDEAFAFLGTESRRYPNYTDLTYVAGVAHSVLGEHESAIAAFQACLERGPAPCPPYTAVDREAGGCKAHLMLGKEYEAVGRYPEALQAYAKAAMMKPRWGEALRCLAALMGKRVDDETTIRVLEAFFPDATDADQVKIAALLAYAGRYQLALERLSPLDAAGSLDRGGRYTLALCLTKLGRSADALTILGEDWAGSPLEGQVKALARSLKSEG
jgi:tetratricopeptide (TPR) repeat protein